MANPIPNINLPTHYIVDTVAIVSAFPDIFQQPPKVSRHATDIIKKALYSTPDEIILHIPSVVFIEIGRIWGKNKEMAGEIYSRIFSKLKDAENVEIVGIEQEVLEGIVEVDDRVVRLEIHDKIIVATAIMYQYQLITCDTKIIEYAASNSSLRGIIQ